MFNQAVSFLTDNQTAIAWGLFAVSSLSSSARGAIAATSEIMQKSVMTDEQALQKASDFMGSKLPIVPEIVRKWIIQILFSSLKKVVGK
jgi:hypothetical protein